MSSSPSTTVTWRSVVVGINGLDGIEVQILLFAYFKLYITGHWLFLKGNHGTLLFVAFEYSDMLEHHF